MGHVLVPGAVRDRGQGARATSVLVPPSLPLPVWPASWEDSAAPILGPDLLPGAGRSPHSVPSSDPLSSGGQPVELVDGAGSRGGRRLVSGVWLVIRTWCKILMLEIEY